MIGIVLPARLMRNAMRGSTSHPTIDYYRQLARNNNIDICFYSMKQVSSKKRTVTGLFYNHSFDMMTKKAFPLPKVNVYRVGSYMRNQTSINKIKRLRKNGYAFFHAVTNKERSKFSVYQYLASNPKTAKYMPDTAMLSYSTLVQMIDRYGKVYIKPIRSSRGRNIHVLESKRDGFVMTHIANFQEKKTKMAKGELYDHFERTFTEPEKFLVQQAVQSDTYKGKKFDFRISPQKNKHGRWQITGMIARIANKCENITNLDQGGRVKYKLSPLINKSTKNNIKKACITIAKTIEAKFPQVIDLGLDMAVDKNGNVWMLEANFRPYRRRINIRHTRIPFQYAVWYYRQKFSSASSNQSHTAI
ncbi:YheC/D like ATP-grasp [Alteribacillus persepolensis]|uniref:YheC/D like ATP-grasp n=1 Tax=Alteribacillus persepolensis TaxID=568899 RepID=A0A1G8B1Q1_9BACI|nr:YheC/YheD family protein [Alteribacillus persepolensis]SDH27045.1 YheC/D like ATP-grasp [Alteribacillus persepolensis]